MRTREVQLCGRALAHLAVHPDVAARLPHESIHLTKAQTRTLPGFLGGEEGLKDSRQGVAVHAGARIRYRKQYVLPWRHGLRDRGEIGLIEEDIRRLDRELASVGHRVACVHRQVEQRLFQLVRICQRRPEARRTDQLKVNVLPDRALQKVAYVSNEAVCL